MITVKQRKFLDSLTDKEYREMFADELVGTSLAFQIRRVREARQLTQSDISGLTGKAQPTISQWEDPNYGRYTLSTLKELAAAFDLALLVRFVSFSELADWTVDVAPDRLTPPSYEDERQMSFGTIDEVGWGPSHNFEDVWKAAAGLDEWPVDKTVHDWWNLSSKVDPVIKTARGLI